MCHNNMKPYRVFSEILFAAIPWARSHDFFSDKNEGTDEGIWGETFEETAELISLQESSGFIADFKSQLELQMILQLTDRLIQVCHAIHQFDTADTACCLRNLQLTGNSETIISIDN